MPNVKKKIKKSNLCDISKIIKKGLQKISVKKTIPDKAEIMLEFNNSSGQSEELEKNVEDLNINE